MVREGDRSAASSLIHIPEITADCSVHMRQANAGGVDQSAVPIDVELAVLEQYPPELRRLFHDAAIKVNCLAFVDYYNWALRNGYGPDRMVSKFRETEANEIAVFAGQHMGRYRYPLPHVAAGATILRYSDIRRKKRRLPAAA